MRKHYWSFILAVILLCASMVCLPVFTVSGTTITATKSPDSPYTGREYIGTGNEVKVSEITPSLPDGWEWSDPDLELTDEFVRTEVIQKDSQGNEINRVSVKVKGTKKNAEGGGIRGIISENGKGLSGIPVELLQGTEKKAAAVTDRNGNYFLGNVDSGDYQFVAADESKGNFYSKLVTISEGEILSRNVDFTDRFVHSKIDFAFDESISDEKVLIRRAVVGGVDRVAENTLAGDDQKIVILFTLEQMKDIGTAEQNAIRKNLSKEDKIEFFNFTLSKQIDLNNPEDIGDTNDTLLTIEMPFDFNKVQKDSIKVFRNHEGSVEELTKGPPELQEGFRIDESREQIVLFARKFSLYAISYREEESSPCNHDDADRNHICDHCGELISDHKGERQEGEKPTYEKPGYKDYYQCSCGKFFEDKDCKTEIPDFEAWKSQGGNGYLPELEKSDPETGYKSHIIVWSLLAAVSFCLLILLIRQYRKNGSVR